MLGLHIGLQKTGSTFLQQNLFPILPGIHYAGDGTELDLKDLRYRDKVLISNENFSGAMVAGKPLDNFRESIQGLARLFPHARPIIGVRDHAGLVSSMYRHYKVWHEPRQDLTDFVDPFRNEGKIDLEDLHLFPRIQLLEKAFENGALVYRTQEFKTNLQGFLTDLVDHLELDTEPEEIEFDPTPVRRSPGRWKLSVLDRLSLLDYAGLGWAYEAAAKGVIRLPGNGDFDLPSGFRDALEAHFERDANKVQEYLVSHRSNFEGSSASQK